MSCEGLMTSISVVLNKKHQWGKGSYCHRPFSPILLTGSFWRAVQNLQLVLPSGLRFGPVVEQLPEQHRRTVEGSVLDL